MIDNDQQLLVRAPKKARKTETPTRLFLRQNPPRAGQQNKSRLVGMRRLIVNVNLPTTTAALAISPYKTRLDPAIRASERADDSSRQADLSVLIRLTFRIATIRKLEGGISAEN